jgi:peptidoglycan/xylan/chitin deacetylase (PgdA/CDA1 family)
VKREVKKRHERFVLWTVDPRDWSRPGVRVIAQRVLDHVRPGSIVLMHDGGGDRSQTVAALRLVIAGLKGRGYSMVTLSRLKRLPALPVPPAARRLAEPTAELRRSSAR